MSWLGRSLVVTAALIYPARANADVWDDLVKHLAPGAKAIERVESRLVVRSAAGTEVIVGAGAGPNVHFYYELRERRGRNPYRVWYVHPAFFARPHVPKRQWPSFFRLSFLRLLRVPKKR